METEKTFKTKTGFCHILTDRIVLTRDGVIGNVAKVTVGNNITRILLIYGAISIGLFYFAFDSYKSGQTFQPFLFGLIGAYLIYAAKNLGPIKGWQFSLPLFFMFFALLFGFWWSAV